MPYMLGIMPIPFIKMHGAGNDFVVLDARAEALLAMTPSLAAAIADRHLGIGCDQVILLERSGQADFAMRIYNADGSESGACGNATRAVGLLHGRAAQVETRGGLLSVMPSEDGVLVDMGAPRFEWQAIPLAYAMDTQAMPLAWDTLEQPTAVNVGNPHAVFFVANCDAIDLAALGPVIEHDPVFHERVNVNVATVTARDALRLRVWERGAGLTRACGTGACATAVAAMRRGLTERRVTVSLPGGALTIAWRTSDGHIEMTGPAAISFQGAFDPSDFGITA